MLCKAAFVLPVATLVVVAVVVTLQRNLPLGPVVLLLVSLPVLALMAAGRPLVSAVPDFVFGTIDTGLLAIPALGGALAFGVSGAVAGGVVGDAVTDAVAGFFEGHVASWLRARGYDESREALATSLGKMAGCLFGAGLVLSAALLLGIRVEA